MMKVEQMFSGKNNKWNKKKKRKEEEKNALIRKTYCRRRKLKKETIMECFHKISS